MLQSLDPSAAASPGSSTITAPILFTSDQIMVLAWLATVAIVLMWIGFWAVVLWQGEKVSAVMFNPSFFKTVAVIGVIAATTVLSLAQRLEGNFTGAILSGTVGYVLGSLSGRSDAATP
jgi:hypothetical protein